MPEVTNELIYEVIKSVQSRLGNLEEGQRDIREELRAIRGHLLATQTDIANVYLILERHELQLRRIEKRLDIVDEPAS